VPTVDPRVQASIDGSLSILPELQARFDRAIAQAPPPRSRNAALLADELGERVIHIAGMHISSALDHVRTMAQVWATNTIPTYSLQTLARTTLENALMAQWLMDSELTLPNQIARGVGAQYADYREREKLEQDLKPRLSGRAKLAVDRRADFMRTAEARGFAKISSEGELVPNRVLPNVTDLFNRYQTSRLPDGRRPPGSTYYRIYSAFAHGKQWSQLLSDLELAQPPHGASARLFSISPNDGLLAGTFTRSINAIGTAVDYFCGHARAPTEEANRRH